VPTDSKKPFKISVNGLQTLSFVLLLPILAIFIYSVYQMRSASKSIDNIPLRLKQSSAVLAIFERQMDSLDTLEENLKRSSERHSDLLRVVNVRMLSSFNADGLDSWRSKAGLYRAQLKQDLGHLQQFNTESNIQINKLALSLKNLLLQEDSQWLSLQQFLEKQIDKTINSEDMELYFEDFLKEFLHTIRALSAYQNLINDSEKNLQALTNREYLKFKRIETESERYKNTSQHYLILIIVSFVLAVVASCGVMGLRIRRERRSRERRKSVRGVEYERRRVDRS
jgi:hypothetical protein